MATRCQRRHIYRNAVMRPSYITIRLSPEVLYTVTSMVEVKKHHRIHVESIRIPLPRHHVGIPACSFTYIDCRDRINQDLVYQDINTPDHTVT